MKYYISFLCWMALLSASVLAQKEFTYSNNWYVGDTETGEWIKHKKIWITEGDYRFTIRAVAAESGKTVALELNGNLLFSGIEAPVDRNGVFQPVHLGNAHITSGYYDVKLIFETGGVNCDMIFIKKDSRKDNTFLETDLEYELNHDDGMHISPIAGASHSSSVLAKYGDPGDNIAYFYQANPANGQVYTREQVMQWNKQPLYTFHMEYSQEAMDILVQELSECKVDFVWAHGRGEPDWASQITDRKFKNGAGGMPCRGLSVLTDAIYRNPYAKNNLKLAYFFDSAASFTSAGTPGISGYQGNTDYESEDFRNFMWDFAIKKWYATVPEDLLFMLPDKEGKGRKIVPMQWWTAGFNVKWGDRQLEFTKGTKGMTGFFRFLEEKMMEEFGLTPAWILGDAFFGGVEGNAVRQMTYGVQAWFIWGQNITEMRYFNDRAFAFALNGGRTPNYESVMTDWNPYTEEGTFTGDYNKVRTKGYHVNALDENGEPVIRGIYEKGTRENAEWLVLESWFDWYEGSTWYRSGHREYAYPNQHLNLCREFADKDCLSILLEAESCDEYYDKSKGNTGGSYRLDWYKESELTKDYWDANLEVDIDVFRPLHQLSEIEQHTGMISSSPNKIVAGFQDVWILGGKNNSIYCNELDGYPVARWNMATHNNYMKKLALGGFSAWGITSTGYVVRSSLPTGQASNVNTSWTEVDCNMNVVDLDVNNAMVWAVDDEGDIYYRNFAATRPWKKLDEGNLQSITVDENFGWGFAPDGSIKQFSLQSKSNWKTIPNPHNLISLDANCEEVWGVNASNEVYRMSASGYGSWEYVASGFKDVSVGTNYVWFLDENNKPHKCSLTSFTDKSVFTSLGNTNIDSSKKRFNPVQILPNPFTDQLKIEVVSEGEGLIGILIYSTDGKLISKSEKQVFAGKNTIDLNREVGLLTKGIYVLKINREGISENHKIIKN